MGEEQKKRPLPKGVASGEIDKKKHFGFKDLVHIFINEDIHVVKDKVLSEVVEPSLRRIAYDTVCNGANWILNGAGAKTTFSGGNPYNNGNRVIQGGGGNTKVITNNNNVNSSLNNPVSIPQNKLIPDPISFVDDQFESGFSKAETYMAHLDEYIDTYEGISILGAYSLAGLSSGAWTTDKYGWKSTAGIQKVQGDPSVGQWLIVFPKATLLD